MGFKGSVDKRMTEFRAHAPAPASRKHGTRFNNQFLFGMVGCLIVANSHAAFAVVESAQSIAQASGGDSPSAAVPDANEHPAASPTSELGDQLEKRLEDLESHFFGHIYRVEPAEKRVARLERFVFGTESGGPFIIRINHIASTLSVADPDGSKHEIKLHAKDAPPPAVVQNQPKAPEEWRPGDASGVQIPNIVGAPEEHSNKLPPEVAVAQPVRIINPPDSSVNNNKPMGGQTPKLLVLQVTKGTFNTVGNPNEMIRELDQAIRVHPSDADLMFERAKAFIQIDKLSSALNDLSDAIMHDPNKSAYYLARAWCYKKLGNSFLAADDIKQARFVDPGLPLQIDLLQNPKSIANETPQ